MPVRWPRLEAAEGSTSRWRSVSKLEGQQAGAASGGLVWRLVRGDMGRLPHAALPSTMAKKMRMTQVKMGAWLGAGLGSRSRPGPGLGLAGAIRSSGAHLHFRVRVMALTLQ